MNYSQYMSSTGRPIRMILDPVTGEFAPDEESLAALNEFGMAQVDAANPQTLASLAQPRNTVDEVVPYGAGQTSYERTPEGRKVINVQGQRAPSLADSKEQINALMSKIAAMTQPGYSEAHPDMAYSSRSYAQGVPDIQNRPEYQQLMALLGMERARNAAMPERKAELSPYEKKILEGRAEADLASQPGTIAYKRVQDEERAKRKEADKAAATIQAGKASQQYSERVASEVDTAIAALFNTTPDKLPELFGSDAGLRKAERETESATGVFDTSMFSPTMFTSTANVEERAKRLQNLAELMGLTNLRKSGVAPGSITEKEWPKFGSQLGTLSLRMGDKEFVQEMARIWKKNQELRGTGQLDLDEAVKSSGGAIQTPASELTSTQVQESLFNARKAIQRNPANRAAIIEKLRANGIDPKGL